MKVPDLLLEETIARLVSGQGSDASICPSEVAREIAEPRGFDWRELLFPIREAAVRMARDGRIAIMRNGALADPDTFRGIYRLAPGRPRPRIVLTVEDLLKDEPAPESPPFYLPPLNFDDDPVEEPLPPEDQREEMEEPPADPAEEDDEDDEADWARPPHNAQLEDIAGILRGYLGDDTAPQHHQGVIEIVQDGVLAKSPYDILSGMADQIVQLQAQLWSDAAPQADDEFDREAIEAISLKLGGIAKQLRSGVLTPAERRYPEITRLVEEIAAGVIPPALSGRLIDIEQRYRLLDIASERDLASEFYHASGGDTEIVDDVVGLPREEDIEPVLPQGHFTVWRDFKGPPSDEE